MVVVRNYFSIETELDKEYVEDVIRCIENNDYKLTEEQLEDAIEMKKAHLQSSPGRPSKVDRWVEKIEDGDATLEDAREDMSDPTWYKLKKRVDK